MNLESKLKQSSKYQKIITKNWRESWKSNANLTDLTSVFVCMSVLYLHEKKDLNKTEACNFFTDLLEVNIIRILEIK